MSLLIKALDKAEKDQAKNSQTAKEEADELSSAWSLEEIDKEPINASHRSNINRSILVNEASSAELNIKEPVDPNAIKHNELNKQLPSHTDSEIAEWSAAPLLSANQGYLASATSNASQRRANKMQDHTKENQARLNQQGQAANVFSAKRLVDSKGPKKVVLVGFVSLFALLLIGAGLYSFYFNKPVLPAKPSFTQTPPQVAPMVAPATVVTEANQAQINNTKDNSSVNSSVITSKVTKSVEVKQLTLLSQHKARDTDFVRAAPTPKLKSTHSDANKLAANDSKLVIASPSTTVTITKNKPEAGVNPTLLNAYQAYTAGDDAKAQQLYKQVLQSETHNTDAMLGLAAIAQRHNRTDDAAGWYRKVLELDPKNAIAQSSLINTQLDNSVQADPVASETRLKNLLAQQPENASLQAALGSLYADQNQWPSAQLAYFEAHRLAPSNADYTFNLAASLDQMGKPKLALPYYKRTLELLPTSANTGISESVVKARIKAIE